MTNRPKLLLRPFAHQISDWITSPQGTLTLGEPFFRLIGLRHKWREIDLPLIKRALVVRLDEIGDVVLTSPFLRELRRNISVAWITLVVKPEVHNLVELCPYVNEVLTYDWNTPQRLRDLRRHGRVLRLAWSKLWRRRFDLAIVPRWDVDLYHASFLAYISGARWRIGYSEDVTDYKRRANAGYDRLFTHTLNDRAPKHEVEHNLDVLRFLGGSVQDNRPELWLDPEDEVSAERCLLSHHVQPGELLIAFGLGAGSPKRMWPLANYLMLGAWLSKKDNTRILVIGGKTEKQLGQALRQELGEMLINVAGQTTLRQSGALLKRCKIFVGNDAGSMHIAAAAGVPTVEISCHPIEGSPSHYNSPVRFRPWGVPNIVLQPETALSPCANGCEAHAAHCITQVSLDQVQDAINRLPVWPINGNHQNSSSNKCAVGRSSQISDPCLGDPRRNRG